MLRTALHLFQITHPHPSSVLRGFQMQGGVRDGTCVWAWLERGAWSDWGWGGGLGGELGLSSYEWTVGWADEMDRMGKVGSW